MITTTLLLLGESSPVNSPFNTRPLPLIHSFQPFNIVAEVIKKKRKKSSSLEGAKIRGIKTLASYSGPPPPAFEIKSTE